MNAKRAKSKSTPPAPANWDDLRLLLSVIRGGSFLSAARELRVAVSTVSRRIVALERRIGTALLERRSDGAIATEAGRTLGEFATHIELELAATLREVGWLSTNAESKSFKGTIRISAGDGFAPAVTECIARFALLHPDVEFEFAVESRVVDLHKREADIAIRTVHRQERSLVYSRLGDLHYALWASANYLRKHGTPKSIEQLKEHRFIGFAAPLDKHLAMKWLRSLGVTRISARANNFRAQLLSAQKDLGIAALPKTAANKLIEVLPGVHPEPLPLYFVSHPQALRRPLIRAFADMLIAEMRKRLAT